MKNNRIAFDLFLVNVVSLCLVLSSCASKPTLAPTSRPASIPTFVPSNTTHNHHSRSPAGTPPSSGISISVSMVSKASYSRETWLVTKHHNIINYST